MRLALTFCLALAACQKASAPSSSAIGKIDAVQGAPTLTRAGKTTTAAAGSDVFAGDRLATPAAAKARVVFSDGSILAAGPSTTLTIGSLSTTQGRRKGSIGVVAGRFWMQISKWTGGSTNFEVATPNAVAGVRGTTLWGDTEVDAICALDGEITVRNKQAQVPAVTLTAGHCAAELSKGRLSPLAPTAEQVSQYLDEVLIR